MKKKLTDAVVKNLSPERGQKTWLDISDESCRGLILRVTRTGEKHWSTRLRVNGVRERRVLGMRKGTSASSHSALWMPLFRTFGAVIHCRPFANQK